MNNLRKLTLAFSVVLLCQNLSAQTADSDYVLNILQPFSESIPSSEIGGALFGASIEEPIFGELVYALDSVDVMTDIDTMACDLVNNISGKIALVNRGICFFTDKALNVQQAGAIVCIICNFEDDVFVLSGTGPDINIPTILLSSSQCQGLKDALDAGEIVELGLSQTTTSLQNIFEDKQSLKFSPNPIQRGQSVLIESEINQNLTYQLVSIDGQLIQSGNLDGGKLQIPEQIPTGLYLINLIDENGKNEFGKLVIH